MEPTEASEKSNDPQEVIDLQDDHLMHRDEKEPQPEPEPLEEVLTNDIEKDPPPTKAKRPRSKAQQEAFRKAQAALKAKREAAKADKGKQPKKTRGRPVKRGYEKHANCQMRAMARARCLRATRVDLPRPSPRALALAGGGRGLGRRRGRGRVL